MEENLVVNDGKSEVIEVDGKKYQRLAIKTSVVTKDDDLKEVVKTYAAPNIEDGDVLFISGEDGGLYPGKGYSFR